MKEQKILDSLRNISEANLKDANNRLKELDEKSNAYSFWQGQRNAIEIILLHIKWLSKLEEV